MNETKDIKEKKKIKESNNDLQSFSFNVRSLGGLLATTTTTTTTTTTGGGENKGNENQPSLGL